MRARVPAIPLRECMRAVHDGSQQSILRQSSFTATAVKVLVQGVNLPVAPCCTLAAVHALGHS